MIYTKRFVSIVSSLLLLLFVISACKSKERNEAYKIKNVDFAKVHMHDAFWQPRIQLMHDVTIPHIFHQSEITGRLSNFRKAGGMEKGVHKGYHFNDSDVYKAIEAASNSLKYHPDPKLEAKLDTMIDWISSAQEVDGYIYTTRTIMGENAHIRAGKERWELVDEKSHELYCMGHLIEAGIAHYEATQKRSLYDVAVKSAELICNTFGPGKIEKFPGHQGIEIAMLKLYEFTGDAKYLNMSEFFLDARGPGLDSYRQAHKKVVDQHEAVGHAVRAVYMYTAMTDVAAYKHREDYNTVLDNLWHDMVEHKMYVTGGFGSGNGYGEGIGSKYFLPNNAYCETCSSIGNMFWNDRLFRRTGNSKYFDILERNLFNSFLSGISLSGDEFFYTNPLEVHSSHERKEWYSCACCPPNIARVIASVSGYVYATDESSIYVNLFAASDAQIPFNNEDVNITQNTSYPWNGNVSIEINTAPKSEFALKVRIPGWLTGQVLYSNLYMFNATAREEKVPFYLNGEPILYKLENGYAVVENKWKKGDKLSFNFPMDVQTIAASDSVVFTQHKNAVQRGPFVYCLEAHDQADNTVVNKVMNKHSAFKTVYRTDKLGGIVEVETNGENVVKVGTKLESTATNLVFIPYYAWANRGQAQMSVWVSESAEAAVALPQKKTIASQSSIKASNMAGNLICLNDNIMPSTSVSFIVENYNWRGVFNKNSNQWIEYNFNKAYNISEVGIYWATQKGNLVLPKEWSVQYLNNGKWEDIVSFTDYELASNKMSKVTFERLKTEGIRVNITLNAGKNSGIYELAVY